MRKFRRVFSFICSVTLLIVTLFSVIPAEVVSAGDYSVNGCVRWARARAQAKLGISLPATGSWPSGVLGASNWWTVLPNAGYASGQEPRANSLAIWRYCSGEFANYGHVAYVDAVEGDTVITSEGGWTGQTFEGNTGVGRRRFNKSQVNNLRGSGLSNFLGYVYLQKSNANPSIQVTSCGVDDHNIWPHVKIYNPNKALVTTVGVQVRDGENIIAQKEEMMTAAGRYSSTSEANYNCVSELGKTLRAGHTYTWQIYANVGGQIISTGWQTVRTTGSERPNKPNFYTSKSDYAVGDAVTVNWSADSNATGGYSVTITQTKGGEYTKTLTTGSANATSLAFTLPNEGEYKIEGFAKGSSNSESAALNKVIKAHNPCKVRFVELDKEGEENLLCEQTVKYGYNAQAPVGVSRKGHQFIGWDKEYTNITSDRTITAKFKRNTYQIVFCDKDGKEIKTENVLFEDSATTPDAPEPEAGYVFVGWDSEDYKNVQGNATIRASYVWANKNLPVLVTINKCEFKDDGYIINYDIKNNPDSRTKGRALVSLKTSKGKLLASTESKAFSIGKGEEKKGLEIYVPYEGTATKAYIYIINEFSKGIPISAVQTIDVERNWSEWSPEEPEGNNEVEMRTEYRYQDKENTTTRQNINEGWNLDKTILDSNWTYGNWSGWSRSSYSGYVNQTTRRDVETRGVQDSNAYTLYNWYYYRYWNASANTYYYTYSSSMGGTRYDWQTTYCLPQIGTWSGHAGYKPAGGKNFSNEIWWLASTQDVPATSHTEWRYRDATKGYTYYWSRWKDWTDWSGEEQKASDNRKVETRTAYRYRAKMTDVEDNTGKSYTISGSLDKELVGKQAILLVYKNDEPSDSNNEFVGQGIIGEEGEYEFTFIPKQEISADTGDYSVALAIEGASEPVFLEKIKAPKPIYTVTFKDNDGKIIDTQKVREGESAESPKVEDKEHYVFIGWDYGLTNIRDDMEITARYEKCKYSVAYVNWEVREAETKIFSYGDPIDYPEETDIEGYDFIDWTRTDGTKVDTVTENLVLQANYKIHEYTVRFFDKNEKLIVSQQIPYGKDAEEPEHEEIDQMIFKGWNTYEFVQVKKDIDVYPVYEWIETTQDPDCDVESGVLKEEKDIHLTCEDGAAIYYTTDGTMPNEFSNKYDGKITISKNTYLQYVAVAPYKNMSETKSVFFLVASGEDNEGALSIKKEKYEVDRGSDSKISYYLSDKDKKVQFYSLDDNIGSVDKDGNIHGNNVGKTTIFVSTEDYKYADFCEVEVSTTDVDVKTIELDKSTVLGHVDDEVQIKATVSPENATNKKIDWYVEDENIAKVTDSGKVKLVGVGNTYLHAYSETGNYIAECRIASVGENETDIFKVSPQVKTMNSGDKDTLIATYAGIYVNASYQSSNPSVAKVDENGVVTAISEGTAIITAISEKGDEALATIIVQKKSIQITEDKKLIGLNIEKNTVRQLKTELLQNDIVCKTPSGKVLTDDDVIGTGTIVTYLDSDGDQDSVRAIITGDINGDGSVGTADVTLMARNLVGIISLSDDQKSAGDVVGDEKVNNKDINMILKMIVGKN